MYKIKKIGKQNLTTLLAESRQLGAPKKNPLRRPAWKSFYFLKNTFNKNKLSDGLGSHTVLNKNVHIYEYTRSYFKSLIKIDATNHPPAEG